ncbi:S15/NS1 RNA-binding domain-containing protein [Basidiobolus meristosporus CBS 931.73]|uniref:S15/NS1 RNA-binding domain-containing protein n=1 Tax=Basidiobolus meristosporus CBS 931.73 TaxID=1314790 RepID=A0A1Y1YX67_9FUNG|nr:S15/NS1 RNA-binding domain-containing protein [Basidiobolus meristosporus CBS 931.73]|eukprot:ORY02526.1 S15/NS1 RNA-binding domain-containing protein [Basidiobolus meristosporus CBS 931.73]
MFQPSRIVTTRGIQAAVRVTSIQGARSIHCTSSVFSKKSKKAKLLAEREAERQEAEFQGAKQKAEQNSEFLQQLLSSPNLIPKKDALWKAPTDTQYQHFLSNDEAKFLFETTTEAVTATSSNSFQTDAEKIKEQAEMLRRLVSLENSNQKGIMLYNIRKAMETFGRCEGDTGSPEVQAAIWTVRIRNLERHMVDHHKDVHNRRSLVHLLHKRAKMLRYLKGQSLERYYVCLKQLGLTKDMVEGEIPLTLQEEEQELTAPPLPSTPTLHIFYSTSHEM